jgi:hypothetical protein
MRREARQAARQHPLLDARILGGEVSRVMLHELGHLPGHNHMQQSIKCLLLAQSGHSPLDIDVPHNTTQL